jgi:hypothetical protein
MNNFHNMELHRNKNNQHQKHKVKGTGMCTQGRRKSRQWNLLMRAVSVQPQSPSPESEDANGDTSMHSLI